MFAMMNGNQNEIKHDNSIMAETLSQFAKSTFTTENIEAAGRFTKEKVMELRAQAQEGDKSLRFLALVGGIGCIVVGLFELTSRIMGLQLVGAIIELYVILLGTVVVILEGKDMLLSKSLVQYINKYALVLKFLWGRGALYFICGTLQLTQIDLFNLAAGGYMCAVGILYIVVGNKTANKLRAIRKSLYTEGTLRTKFRAADIEGDGLSLKQFRSLCENLGLDLTAREAEATFGFIQKMGDSHTKDKLSYEEFKRWWDDLDGEGQLDDNAFIFV
mmetsp:Transcript_18384/g.41961  ORF Transcript_18384/g.41961 Transcript_18384/m.41961 type:complete len:274 (+) Transcript_18384:122-943(+)